MSTRKRCAKGTRRDKKTEKCLPVVRLDDAEIDRLIDNYKLDKRARPFLKKLVLRKKLRYNNFYKYDPKHTDETNMSRQGDAVVAAILKYGSKSARRKIKMTPKFRDRLGTAI